MENENYIKSISVLQRCQLTCLKTILGYFYFLNKTLIRNV